MRIQHNISSLNSNQRLRANQNQISKTLEKLSSGLKINGASDDAAGLVISEGMRAQIRGLERASVNVQDAISYVDTADAQVQEVTQVVQRMRELTIQALNDTNSEQDRRAIQNEIKSLQEAITNVTENSTYNDTLNTIDAHQPSFGQLTGNHFFNGPVRIDEGINDSITFIAGGTETTIKLPPGTYEPVDLLIDKIDTILEEVNPNIILDVADNGNISVQIENVNDIVKIKGTGSFLFYEYELGNTPGMIIGTTDFSTGDGKLWITPGKNDTLSLYVGPTNKITINFPGNRSYTRDEVIDRLNTYLNGTGASASAYGEKNIAISSDKYVVTGLGGNMLEIDGYTSILYDIADYGSVNKYSAMYSGSALLPANIEIGQETRYLEVKANTVSGIPATKTIQIDLLKNADSIPSSISRNDLVSIIQTQMDEADLNAKVTLSGTSLRLTSNFVGNGSVITVNSSSSAYDLLFNRHYSTLTSPTIANGSDTKATIKGLFGNRENIVIDDSNNEFVFKIDGVTHSIDLDNGNYNAETMVELINEKFTESGLSNLEAIVSTSGTKQAFYIINNNIPGSLEFEDNPAFKTLFYGSNVFEEVVVQGRDGELQYPDEGEVGTPTIPKLPATVTGQISIGSSFTVDDTNNMLSFSLNGNYYSIQLTNKTYSNTELLTAINLKLTGIPIQASYSGNKLQLTTTDKGQGVTLENVNGLGMELYYESSPSLLDESSQSTAKVSRPGLEGRIKGWPVTIVDGQNTMYFNYTHEGVVHNLSISIPPGEYENASIIKTFFAAGFYDLSIDGNPISNYLSLDVSGSNLSITAKESGASYNMSDFSGGLFDLMFRRTDYIATGYGYSGRTVTNDPAYIVGRQELSETIEIFPSNNDVLTFDLTYKGNTYTIDVQVPANTYTKSQFIQAFNQALEKSLEDKGLRNDIVHAQVGAPGADLNVSNENKFTLITQVHDDGRDDNGLVKIEGVRGSGAYTYFYRSQGEASPSHVIGIVDLSQGVTIQEDFNDELSIDVDGQTKTMKIPSGEYTADQFLIVMNDILSSSNSGLIASYDNGKLKLSYRENGPITIDGFVGSARDYLFFKTDRREEQQELKFQVGANSNQYVNYYIVRLSDKLMRINTIQVITDEGAEKALGRIDDALTIISTKTSFLGAIQNRLEYTLNVNLKTNENLVNAESLIRDADMAKEMMTLTKQNILAQASLSMLTQSNKSPEIILQLLQ